jgi:DNA-3-methyladenine glycosylase I
VPLGSNSLRKMWPDWTGWPDVDEGSGQMSADRCPWAESSSLMRAYHDTEWGMPVRDDQTLFEFLVLEGAQAGLSWATVLRKRENYRNAFDNFDPVLIALYTDEDAERLLADPGIIRNRRKILSAINNARRFLDVQAEFGTFAGYLWQFVDCQPIKNTFGVVEEVPATSSRAEAMSKELRKRGFTFVGPTICYAHMQATGMVNDHLVSCFRHSEV